MILWPDTTGYQFSRSSFNFELLKSERARLNTFHSEGSQWPVPFICPSACAKAGFFFLKDGDKVQCAFCKGVAGEWEEGDVPLTEHKKHFPRCPFICNLPVGNIPIGQVDAAVSRLQEEESPESYGYDVCGPFENLSPNTFYNSDQVHVRGALPITGDADDVATSLAIKTGSGPARKHLVTVESRLKTFGNWPSTTGQRPETMAEAGFFYIGTRDHVKCFYCDGGLRNWEECDDPWFEHARWFASCPYVILNKGPDYIKNVVESKPPTATTIEPKTCTSSESDTESTFSNSSVVKDKVTPENSISPSSSSESPSPTPSTSSQSETPPSSDIETSESSDEDAIIPDSSSKAEKDSRKLIECILPPPSETNNAINEGNLEEELRKLKEARQCKICMDNEVGVVFLPCGHLVSCVRCATALSNCALCRQPIKAVVRTYLS